MIILSKKLQMPLSDLMETEIYAIMGVSAVFEYKNGVKTDNVTAIRYSVANPDTFESFDVKVLGNKAVVTQEQIEQSEERLWLTFENAIVKPYKIEYGKAICTVIADSAKLAK